MDVKRYRMQLMRTRYALLCLPLFVAGCLGCGGNGTGTNFGGDNMGIRGGQNNPTQPGQAPDAAATRALAQGEGAKVVQAANAFGLDLLLELIGEEPDQNAFISPASIATALSMTYMGAGGETRQAMAKAMRLGELGPDVVATANQNLLSLLRSADPKVQLQVANSLWARQGIEFRPEFMQTNRTHFSAQVEALNFSDPVALKTINKWVSDRTQGRIPQIVDSIPPDAVLYLINAIYFKGQWQHQFDKKLTEDQPFTLLNGSTVQAPLMQRHGDYPHFQGENYQAVRLPYGRGRLGMVVFLPNGGTSLHELVKHIRASSWAEVSGRLKSMKGDVFLPRFKMEYKQELSEQLKALGMEVAFQPNAADFTGMRSERDLYIQAVLHRTFVEVNEEGTEAAATTGVQIGITSMPETFTFRADRPFFFVIEDRETNMILFTGLILDPTK
jgi:serine protease inhibitor